MASESLLAVDETQPLTTIQHPSQASDDESRDSLSSASTTSLVLEGLNDYLPKAIHPQRYTDKQSYPRKQEAFDIEDGQEYHGVRPVDKKYRRLFWILGLVGFVGWLLALLLFVSRGTYQHSSSRPHDPAATVSRGSGKKVTLEQTLNGVWYPMRHALSWIAGADGEDGLLLERGGGGGKDYLIVEDVRQREGHPHASNGTTLMKQGSFYVGSTWVSPSDVWPSADLKKVLVMSDREKNWRHSFTGRYWIFDVHTQTGEALDPDKPGERIQLAKWSPTSDAIVFTRNNNMFLRKLSSKSVTQITKDGGKELFYGIPDWVYEEEVFSGNSATWWSEDGKYIALLRTDESAVPTYPVQYFFSRPSHKQPKPGEENYPDVRNIKYPKAGAPNPIVNLQFYDMAKDEIFSVPIDGDFEDSDRLITEVIWAGRSGKVLVRETNRESDLLKLVLMDVERRSGKTVRTQDVAALDGGWFEITEHTVFVPSDPGKGRAHDGYVDTIIHEGYNHLGYFTPLDNSEPVVLTSGKWEVVNAPSAVDLVNNLVYFVATKESSIQRHVYRVNLDGSNLAALTDTGHEGYYEASFSAKAGYALLSYDGPNIPWQKVISTPSSKDDFESLVEDNKELAKRAAQHELPIEIYSTINVDGFDLNYVERRPPHFDSKRRYPVLFYLYNGPMSQQVDKRFGVDFQSYIASSLGYIVVTVDGRGTGFLGRKARNIVRDNIGYYESHDQIAAAKVWAKKKYVDENRMAIWGWSYGGFMTLKTLEQDAGRTFKYGMAVAPVTDWRFYDSIYTERYMHTPQNNPSGYDNATISNATALSQNVRFLVMHGIADDNVHTQSTFALIDRLDLAGVENYDVHVFPDSDHSIYFHNAHRIVYDKLNNWLINAFNGEWLKTEDPIPLAQIDGKVKLR
ncbi:hypothetical protein H2201_000646 [Coniosporium apollinis]|uniref:dipeptidyl-peptidase IV n=1 Tax=Coniosporium apollinis TaxID=61459 RepID=A0ABQ9P3X8_9PEZI|nr:hypothetical protein H2201_000646 [Coniosporium apollinis]